MNTVTVTATTSTTTAIKMTKAQAFTALMELSEVQARPELMDFCTHEMDMLLKNARRKAERKPKVNPETAQRRQVVMEVLVAASEPLTCGAVAQVAGLTLHQCNAALSSLVKDGAVQRSEVKRVAYFGLPTIEEDAE